MSDCQFGFITSFPAFRLKVTRTSSFPGRNTNSKKIFLKFNELRITTRKHKTILFEKKFNKETFQIRRELGGKNKKIKLFISSIALVGAIETFMITYLKINSSPIVCGSFSCSSVLSSPFSDILGFPISLFGFFVYTILLFMNSADIFDKFMRDRISPNFSLFLGIFLSFSGIYFVLILKLVLSSSCGWCLTSIFLSSLAVISRTFSLIGLKIKNQMSVVPLIIFLMFSFLLEYCFSLIEFNYIG